MLSFMQKLTKKEEEIMQLLWQLGPSFVKEVQAAVDPPRPHYNTVSTIVRNLEEKGYVGHHAFGKTHRYFPLISKDHYRKGFMSTAISQYFNNSYKNVVSFFAEEQKISIKDLKEIIELIEKK